MCVSRKEFVLWQQLIVITFNIYIFVKRQEWVRNPFPASAFVSPLSTDAILNFDGDFDVDANVDVTCDQQFAMKL